MLSRLEKLGLLAATEDGDKRGWKNLIVTADGEKHLKAWILSGSDQALIASIMDPLRNRISFLKLLDTEQQIVYLDELLVLMDGFYQQTKDRLAACPKSDDLYQHMVALGAMQSTESRLKWLVEVKKLLLE